jgi:hypothetical protein
MWYQRATRALRLRRFLLVGMVLVIVAYALFQDRLLAPFAPTCTSAPDYLDEVPQELRSKLDGLRAAGLLYCVEAPEELARLQGPVYWGSDGVNSLLFFQASDLAGTGVQRYAYSQNYLPAPAGGPSPTGYTQGGGGRVAYLNEAPDGAPYYLRTLGAPTDTDLAVAVDITGPAIQNESLLGRNFWRDLDNLVRAVRGESAVQRATTVQRVSIPIIPARWEAVRRRVVAPELANADGAPDLAKLREVPAGQVRHYQTLNGPLGAGIWFTGVLSDTTPALVLVPRAGGQALRPEADPSLWTSSTAPGRVAGFAFPTLTEGAVYEAGYWHDAARAEVDAPDLKFPIVAP